MKAAGLIDIDTVLTSTAVLVKSRNSKHPLLNLMTSRIHGVISMLSSLMRSPLSLFPRSDSSQLPKNISYVNITSLGRCFPRPVQSPQASVPRQSPLWKRMDGLQCPQWLRRRLSQLLWMN